MSLHRLTGKYAVVTGAANGIGRSLVEELVAQGVSVCLADIEQDELERTTAEISKAAVSGVRVFAQVTDVSDPVSVQSLAAAVTTRFGEIDLLCTNAGVTSPYGGAPDETPLADWHRQMNVNLFGIVHCLQAFLPDLRKKSSPSHVLITASSSGILPTANRAAYCASKHAVVGLGESLFLQLKTTNIGVTLLCPGITATRLLESDLNRPDGKPGRPLNPALLAKAKSPRDVARMAVEAVKSGRFWVLTHDDLGPAVIERAAAMAAGALPPDSYH
jgi:NAD(P)-dependent dehydrogenase (short-subunit alcohol dehydrogenase family)